MNIEVARKILGSLGFGTAALTLMCLAGDSGLAFNLVVVPSPIWTMQLCIAATANSCTMVRRNSLLDLASSFVIRPLLFRVTIKSSIKRSAKKAGFTTKTEETHSINLASALVKSFGSAHVPSPFSIRRSVFLKRSYAIARRKPVLSRMSFALSRFAATLKYCSRRRHFRSIQWNGLAAAED